jgi:hypothetical protein
MNLCACLALHRHPNVLTLGDFIRHEGLDLEVRAWTPESDFSHVALEGESPFNPNRVQVIEFMLRRI